MNVLEKELLAPIFIRGTFAEKVFRTRFFSPQKSSELRECVGVELVGGQLRQDDEFVKWIRLRNLVNGG